MSPNYEPVSPVDITGDRGSKRIRSVGFSIEDLQDEKSDFKAITQSVPSRSNSTASSTTPSVVNPARKTRFAEATSVFSPEAGPGEHQSPFAMANNRDAAPKPSDVGFGYIADNQPIEQHATLRSDFNQGGPPLKSAMKTPGTAARLLNPLSPTFREEQVLEKQEDKTEKEQAKDLVCFVRFFYDYHLLISPRKPKLVFAWPKWSFAVSIFHAV
jgi:hypothetical protein